ncbi:MAG: GNAT family N-acetyltransferase [Kiloniellaceae bacterium]
MSIREDDLRGPEIAALLEAHLDLMRSVSPPESVHALDLDALRAPQVTFWTVWDGDTLLGCGALKEIDPTHGEIKSMHTAQAARGKGVARRLLQHVVDTARQRGYRRLSLETGSTADFAAAQGLYGSFGFEVCGPFADYVLDPFSVFMTLELDAGPVHRGVISFRSGHGD